MLLSVQTHFRYVAVNLGMEASGANLRVRGCALEWLHKNPSELPLALCRLLMREAS